MDSGFAKLTSWICEASGRRLTGLTADSNPEEAPLCAPDCGAPSHAVSLETREGDDEMGVNLISLFFYQVGFSKVTYRRRPSHSAAWVTLPILSSRYSLGAGGPSA